VNLGEASDDQMLEPVRPGIVKAGRLSSDALLSVEVQQIRGDGDQDRAAG
jgi:hypothetical protein